jgi:serine/threonine-protein kinase
MSSFRIGRYQAISELGSGGMAVVYLAHDPYINRRVAIKLLSAQMTSDKRFHGHFQREAEVIAALEHPCIVPVFDYGWHRNQPYIVMRHMVGGSLKERLDEQGVLDLNQLSRIVDRVAEGLDAAHAQGIIHRDVKPSNILFDKAGEPFLADFGIAKILHRATSETGPFVLGTPRYMSPEQITNSPLDGRSDVYALGVLIFQALAGQTPFAGTSSQSIAQAHLKEPVPKILALNPDLRPPWEEIIEKVMAKKPDDRYVTAGELAADVQQVVSGRWYFRKLTFD